MNTSLNSLEVNMSNELDNLKTTEENEQTIEKIKKRTIFNDLNRFRKRFVSILTFSGEIVQGKLIGYDEVANCIIQKQNGKNTIVFGKVISLVCEGELNVL